MQRQTADLARGHNPEAALFSRSIQSIARSALHFRARRRRILGSANFSDPAWDLLLMLAANGPDAEVSCADVAWHAAVTPKVVLRFAGLLAAQGLVEIEQRAETPLVKLTPSGHRALTRLID